jgi:hypothetical protein
MPTYRVPAGTTIEVEVDAEWLEQMAAETLRFQAGDYRGEYLHFRRDGFVIRVRKGLVEKVNRLPINRPRYQS